MLRYLRLKPVPAACIVDVAGVVPQAAALPRGLAAALRHQQGRVGGPPATTSPVKVGLTPATTELQQQTLLTNIINKHYQ